MEGLESENTAARKKLKRLAGRHWAVTIAVAVLPCVVTGFFTYRQAKVEAQAKVEEAHVKAEAGYDALVKAVEKLQTRDEATTKNIAELTGHITVIEAWMMGMRAHVDPRTKETHLDLPVPREVRDKTNWRPNFPPKVTAPVPANSAKIDLPASLDQAAAAKK